MSDGSADVSRRALLRTAAGFAGTATATGAAGTAAAQSDGNESSGGSSGGGSAPAPDLGGYLDDTSNYEGNIVDRTGQESVTIKVGVDGNQGTNAYGPPAVHVDPGTSVVWEWTGDGSHNVVHEGGNWESGAAVADASTTYERTFETGGLYKYYCTPHKPFGMKGVVIVGSDYPTVEQVAAGEGAPIMPDSAKSLGLAASFVMAATLGLSYLFLRYGASGPRADPDPE